MTRIGILVHWVGLTLQETTGTMESGIFRAMILEGSKELVYLGAWSCSTSYAASKVSIQGILFLFLVFIIMQVCYISCISSYFKV